MIDTIKIIAIVVVLLPLCVLAYIFIALAMIPIMVVLCAGFLLFMLCYFVFGLVGLVLPKPRLTLTIKRPQEPTP